MNILSPPPSSLTNPYNRFHLKNLNDIIDTNKLTSFPLLWTFFIHKCKIPVFFFITDKKGAFNLGNYFDWQNYSNKKLQWGNIVAESIYFSIGIITNTNCQSICWRKPSMKTPFYHYRLWKESDFVFSTSDYSK